MPETTNTPENEEALPYHKYLELFWVITATYSLLAFVAILGNSLVIYASYRHKNLSPLRYFDGVVRSLACADLFYGLLGMPITVITYYMREL